MSLIFGEGSPKTVIEKKQLEGHIDKFIKHFGNKLKKVFQNIDRLEKSMLDFEDAQRRMIELQQSWAISGDDDFGRG